MKPSGSRTWHVGPILQQGVHKMFVRWLIPDDATQMLQAILVTFPGCIMARSHSASVHSLALTFQKDAVVLKSSRLLL